MELKEFNKTGENFVTHNDEGISARSSTSQNIFRASSSMNRYPTIFSTEIKSVGIVLRSLNEVLVEENLSESPETMEMEPKSEVPFSKSDEHNVLNPIHSDSLTFLPLTKIRRQAVKIQAVQKMYHVAINPGKFLNKSGAVRYFEIEVTKKPSWKTNFESSHVAIGFFSRDSFDIDGEPLAAQAGTYSLNLGNLVLKGDNKIKKLMWQSNEESRAVRLRRTSTLHLVLNSMARDRRDKDNDNFIVEAIRRMCSIGDNKMNDINLDQREGVEKETKLSKFDLNPDFESITVGWGVDIERNEIYFTYNGKLLVGAGFTVGGHVKFVIDTLIPVVGIAGNKYSVVLNSGDKPFLYAGAVLAEDNTPCFEVLSAENNGLTNKLKLHSDRCAVNAIGISLSVIQLDSQFRITPGNSNDLKNIVTDAKLNYFEIEVPKVSTGYKIEVGFMTKEHYDTVRDTEKASSKSGFWRYKSSNGAITGDGLRKTDASEYLNWLPWKGGDVVGWGIDVRDFSIFFTKNGKKVNYGSFDISGFMEQFTFIPVVTFHKCESDLTVQLISGAMYRYRGPELFGFGERIFVMEDKVDRAFSTDCLTVPNKKWEHVSELFADHEIRDMYLKALFYRASELDRGDFFNAFSDFVPYDVVLPIGHMSMFVNRVMCKWNISEAADDEIPSITFKSRGKQMREFWWRAAELFPYQFQEYVCSKKLVLSRCAMKNDRKYSARELHDPLKEYHKVYHIHKDVIMPKTKDALIYGEFEKYFPREDIRDGNIWKMHSDSDDSYRDTNRTHGFVSCRLPFQCPYDKLMLKHYCKVAKLTGNLDMFDSVVCKIGIQRAWELYGKKAHFKQMFIYFTFLVFFTISSLNFQTFTESPRFVMRFRAGVLEVIVLFYLILFLIEELSSSDFTLFITRCVVFVRNIIDRAGFSYNKTFKIIIGPNWDDNGYYDLPAYIRWSVAFVKYILVMPFLCVLSLLHHMRDLWNCIDMLIIAFTAAGTFVRLQHFRETTESNMLLSAASVFVWLKTMFFMRPFKRSGALIAMVLQIVYDIRYFVLILGFVLVGFAQAFWFLSHHDKSLTFGTVSGAMLNSFYFMLGNVNEDITFSTLSPPMATALLVVFMLFMILLMLNLLIALMGDSFVTIKENGVKHWRYEQAKIMLENRSYEWESADAVEKWIKEHAKDEKFMHILMHKEMFDEFNSGETTSSSEKLIKVMTAFNQSLNVKIDALQCEMSALLISTKADLLIENGTINHKIGALQFQLNTLQSALLLQEGEDVSKQ